MKKESPKRYKPPKQIKNSAHNKRHKKDIEKSGKWKRKSVRKVSQRYNDNKVFYLFYVSGKRYAQKHSLGKK